MGYGGGGLDGGAGGGLEGSAGGFESAGGRGGNGWARAATGTIARENAAATTLFRIEGPTS